MERPARGVVDAYAHRRHLVTRYFDEHAGDIARLCFEMARRFNNAGRILAFGVGAAATDAQHVSVEFVHPVIVGKRALPAIALVNDGPTLLGAASDGSHAAFVSHIELLGRPGDIAIGFVQRPDEGHAAVQTALRKARDIGMLTVALIGGSASAEADWVFSVPDADPFVVQEVHETLYHVLWELVHVFFDHRGLLETGIARDTDLGSSAFLYPMLEDSQDELGPVHAEVENSIKQKAAMVCAIRDAQAARPEELVSAAQQILDRFRSGGKVLAFGNGGSATDAQDFVTDLIDPPAGLRRYPALSLTNEEAVVTAVGNDVGFDNVFMRQVIAYGEPGDVAVGFSTSGSSRNVVEAFTEARARKLLTVGFLGYGGGEILQRGLADIAILVDLDYVPRIQEAQATQYHVMRRLLDELR